MFRQEAGGAAGTDIKFSLWAFFFSSLTPIRACLTVDKMFWMTKEGIVPSFIYLCIGLDGKEEKEGWLGWLVGGQRCDWPSSR